MAARTFFATPFESQQFGKFSLDGVNFSLLYEEQSAALSAPFTKNEIWDGLTSCDIFKALGLNGFNFFFYKKAWKIIRTDILKVFSNFYPSGRLPKGLNSFFLMLIPKVVGTSSPSEFWPTSLINGIYKMVSKVLSFHLWLVLPLVISANQRAFLKGRSILDCSMVASELLHIL